MRISRLYDNVSLNHKITSLSFNSKEVKNGDVFYAISGEKEDGSKYIEEAIYNGAKTIIYENEYKGFYHHNINYIQVINVRKQLALDAKVFYKDISRKLKLSFVVGTNGKTSVTTLFYKYLRYLNKGVCLIGTNGAFINDIHIKLHNTTPSIIEIYEILKKAYKMKIKYVIMEVSSHAIKMLRVYGLNFHTVLLTNITKDHLDYHKIYSDYLYTKGLSLTYKHKYTIINSDCNDFDFFYRVASGKIITYGKKHGDFLIKNINIDSSKTEFDFIYKKNTYHVNTKLLAEFNVYNIVSFISILSTLNLFRKNVFEFLNTDIKIDGRMELIEKNDKKIYIDFAHTPDGVSNVLKYLNEIKENSLIVVMACGGDRDKEKRPVMAHLATSLSDFVIFTTDNPRSEAPIDIVNDMIKGCKSKNYSIVLERGEAIKIALDIARCGDIVAILGKGNEDYIIKDNEKIRFNDKEEVLKLLNEE